MTFPLIASHRGGALCWTENTREAFENTARLPVDLVEFDVQRTTDGVLVVFHDATLDRMTDATGPLGLLSWAELSRVRYTDGQPILRLEEVLEIMAPSPVDLRIEIKPGVDLVRYTGIEAEIAAMVEAHGLMSRSQVTAFPLATVEAFAKLARPGRGFVWLVADPLVRLIDDDAKLCALAREAGADQMAMRLPFLSPERVNAAAAEGISLGAFAAHDAESVDRAAECGVAVFTSDRPDIALERRAAWMKTQAVAR
jgi:glycerophosphoryl diester phosphodiesterase